MKKPEYKSAYRLDINYGSINDYVREKERCDGYNKALEESEAYYEELLSGLKEVNEKIVGVKYANHYLAYDAIYDEMKSIATQLGWDKQ